MDESRKVYSEEYSLGFVYCGSPAEAEAIRACLGVGRVETGRFERREEKKIHDAADRAARGSQAREDGEGHQKTMLRVESLQFSVMGVTAALSGSR